MQVTKSIWVRGSLGHHDCEPVSPLVSNYIFHAACDDKRMYHTVYLYHIDLCVMMTL